MQRRALLRTAALLPFLAAGRAGPQSLAKQRVRPGDSAWPDAALWNKLNDDVGGNLLVPQALFGSCAMDPNAARCRDALDNIRNPYWIGDQPAGTEVSGWLGAWTPAPSAYAIRARNAADVARGVSFAREHNLRLVIKGGSHSYLGTSNAPDSLLIWTRAMRKVTLHDAFIGAGCEGRTATVPAVTAEAGAVWMDLYSAVTTEAGRYVQGGGCTTVGVAGLVQSGGFGSFSKGFGTAAAGLLEAEIVTADGRVRVVNECIDPDLFWALKGGGGGTFGVVTRVTLRTHDLPAFFGFAGGTIAATSDAAFADLIGRFVDFYRDNLLNPHWGEQVKLGSDNILEISMVCQGLDDSRAKDAWRPFFDWVRASDELEVTVQLRAGAEDARDWWQVDDSMIRDTRSGAPERIAVGGRGTKGKSARSFTGTIRCGCLHRCSSRTRASSSPTRCSRRAGTRPCSFISIRGSPVRRPKRSRRHGKRRPIQPLSMLSRSRSSPMARAPPIPGSRVRPSILRPPTRMRTTSSSPRPSFTLVPNAGSYVSESNYFNVSWQNAYWGANYSRLRSAKDRYDPDGLFVVHHGVGSEDWSADGFTRIE